MFKITEESHFNEEFWPSTAEKWSLVIIISALLQKTSNLDSVAKAEDKYY